MHTSSSLRDIFVCPRYLKRFIDLVTRNNNAALGFNILSMNQVVLVESNVQVSISISQDIALLVLD